MPPRFNNSHRPNIPSKVYHPFKLFIRMIKNLVNNQIPLVCLIVLLMIIAAGGPVIGTSLLTPILQAAIDKDLNQIYLLLTIQACIFVIAIISSFIAQITMVKLNQNALHRIRARMFKHMEDLPISYFDQRTTGEIMSIYTNDTDTLRQVYSQSCPQIINSIVQFIASCTMMFIYSWVLALISCGFLILVFLTIIFISKKSSRHFMRQQIDLSKLNGFIQEMTNGQRVIKVFNHEKEAINDFKKINERLEFSNAKGNFYGSIMFPAVNNIGYLCFASNAMVGSLLIVSGAFNLQATILASFMNLNKTFMMPISNVASQINFIFQGLAGASRIFSILDADSEVDDGYYTLVKVRKDENNSLVEDSSSTNLWAWKNTKNGELIELKGDIRFNDVDFSYVENKQVLFDINLYAKPGQKIAFVGATGAGKTTITNLLNRFYDIQKGTILFDGIDIKNIKKKDLRNSIAVILQDTNLFTGSIEDNIKYGCPNASLEQVINAAKLSNADSFIRNLPNGYKTIITGNGSSLSQGQKQLISIARAAIMNPPVLVLDEATSSIDTYTESLVQSGMDKLMINRTTFAIAHRLSTVQNCNAIMVLDHGHIIERGTHDQLLLEKGIYYQLYTGGLELE